MAEAWNLREAYLLLDLDDENIFRCWAMDNRYGDSAYAFRRLLDKAGLRVEGDDGDMTTLDLTSFLNLRAGWDGYRAQPITEAAIKTAEALQAVPASHGGVQIEMHAGGLDIEIEIHPNGHVESVFVSRVEGDDGTEGPPG